MAGGRQGIGKTGFMALVWLVNCYFTASGHQNWISVNSEMCIGAVVAIYYIISSSNQIWSGIFNYFKPFHAYKTLKYNVSEGSVNSANGKPVVCYYRTK